MARTEVWVEDDIAPTGRWVWVGGYEGPGVVAPVLATAAGVSTTVGEATAMISGLVLATATGTSSTSGSAVASVASLGQYLSLPGGNNSWATIPDEAALDLTGDHTALMRLRLPDWTPATSQILVSKWPWSSGQWSWMHKLTSGGQGVIQGSTTGTTSASYTTNVLSPAPAANTILWLKIFFDASVKQITWSTHPDQVSEPTSGWTQVGQSVAGSPVTLFSSTADVAIGGSVGSGGTQSLACDFFQLVLRNESDTKVFQLDPDNWTAGSTWVTSTGQTVTLAAAATVESG